MQQVYTQNLWNCREILKLFNLRKKKPLEKGFFIKNLQLKIRGVYVLPQQFVIGAYGSQLFAAQMFYQYSICMKPRVHSLVVQLQQEGVANHMRDI